MSRHCSSVKSVGYDLSFIAPLPQNLTPTRRVNNSPDQMSRDNNCLKFSKPCNGHALRSVRVAMRPIAQYFVGRQLMLGERLPDERWSIFDRSADVICNSILERMPVDHPESAIWDNRRKGDQGALR